MLRNQLRRIRAKKVAGPDSISSRILKSCPDQQCGIFAHREVIEEVQTLCLGVHLGNNLDWSAKTDDLYHKGQSRLFFLRSFVYHYIYRYTAQRI